MKDTQLEMAFLFAFKTKIRILYSAGCGLQVFTPITTLVDFWENPGAHG
jgi:hypothetical protein